MVILFPLFCFITRSTTEIPTLSLHDALPIFRARNLLGPAQYGAIGAPTLVVWTSDDPTAEDRKSTRLNSSHVAISYAVFCLKKKKKVSMIIEHRRTH